MFNTTRLDPFAATFLSKEWSEFLRTDLLSRDQEWKAQCDSVLLFNVPSFWYNTPPHPAPDSQVEFKPA